MLNSALHSGGRVSFSRKVIDTFLNLGISLKLEKAEWNNSTIVRRDVVAEITKLKQQEGRDLLIHGPGLLAETLLKHHLLDVLDPSNRYGAGKAVLSRGHKCYIEARCNKELLERHCEAHL